ncbi:MAG: hypothetical protein VKI81_10030, partial [Synechococcaceae cyanobacterium]|nr:hypothetical protein [Synechococcaceae cyanobacterium]
MSRILRMLNAKTVTLIVLIASIGILLASPGKYSYWLDELYSVTASSQGWKVLYLHWIPNDVHPPLYYSL